MTFSGHDDNTINIVLGLLLLLYQGFLVVSSSPLEGRVDRILLASALLSIRAMCPKRVRLRDWTIAVSLVCPISLWTSSFWNKLVPFDT